MALRNNAAIIAELRRAIAERDAEEARLEKEVREAEERIALLTSDNAKAKAKYAVTRAQIAALDVDLAACAEMEKVDIELVDKIADMADKSSKQQADIDKRLDALVQEMEAAKNRQNIGKDFDETLQMMDDLRFDGSTGASKTKKEIEKAREEMQQLDEHLEVLKKKDEELNEQIMKNQYPQIPFEFRAEEAEDGSDSEDTSSES